MVFFSFIPLLLGGVVVLGIILAVLVVISRK